MGKELENQLDKLNSIAELKNFINNINSYDQEDHEENLNVIFRLANEKINKLANIGKRFNKEEVVEKKEQRVFEFNFIDFSHMPEPKINWINKHLTLRENGVYFLNGFSNAGKSWFGIYLAFCFANNIPVFDKYDFQTTGNALYVDYELGTDSVHYFNKVHYGLDCFKQLKNPKYLDLRNNLYLNDPDLKLGYLQLIKKSECKLIIIDNFIAGSPGTDFNSDDSRFGLDILMQVAQELNVCIILLAHEAKNASDDPLKRVKGSSSNIAAVSGSISLSYDNKSKTVELQVGKKRLCVDKISGIKWTIDDCGAENINTGLPLGIKLNLINNEQIEKDIEEENKLKVLECLSKNILNKEDIAKEVGIRKIKVKDYLEILENEVMIVLEKKGNNTYFKNITEKGNTNLQHAINNWKLTNIIEEVK